MGDRHELKIRRGDAGDLDEVARVWHDSAESMDGAGLIVPPPEAMRLRIAAEFHAGWDLHVAMRGGRVVGMLALKPSDAVLDQIFAAPNAQGRGFDKALLAVARRAMPGDFTLRMDASNHQARSFYEKQGMKVLSEGIHPRAGIPVLFYGWNAPE
jgi:putative acetyltransferase